MPVRPRVRYRMRTPRGELAGLSSLRDRSPRPNAADALDGVAHDVAGTLSRRELGARGYINLRQAIEQVPGALARLDGGSSPPHGVVVHENADHPRRIKGQHDARIPLNVSELHVPRHVTTDEIVAVQSNPD